MVTIKSSIYVSESRFERKLDRFRKLKLLSQAKGQWYEWLEHPSFALPRSDPIFHIDPLQKHQYFAHQISDECPFSIVFG